MHYESQKLLEASASLQNFFTYLQFLKNFHLLSRVTPDSAALVLIDAVSEDITIILIHRKR